MKKVDLTDKKQGEKHVTLEKSDNMLVVRFRPDYRQARADNHSWCEKKGAEIVHRFASAGSYIIRIHRESDTRQVKEALRKEPGIDYAGSAYLCNGEPVVYTGNAVIVFSEQESEATCQTFFQHYTLKVKNKIAELGQAWLVEPNDPDEDIFSLCDKLLKNKRVDICHPEILHVKARKVIHPNQWHLMPTVVTSTAYIDASANVARAHEITKGEGTVIAIIDDGFDLRHPELAANNKIIFPANFGYKYFDHNPVPHYSDERHGTACAGVALASGYYGASGVAPEAKFIPVLNENPLGSFSEAATFIWASDRGADVISCSWGPLDGAPLNPDDPLHQSRVPLYPLTRRAIDYAVKNGRQGKGCAIFFAAGNGNESVDNDGYASYKAVFAVAACNDRSQHSYYSDRGDAIFCSFPSSDIFASRTPGIWTTDCCGRAGYNRYGEEGDRFGNYTNAFGGTSSACPGAAGVAALVLSVHGELTLAQLRDILRNCCDKIDSENGNYDENGHSLLYGYGRLNAENAVRLALELKREAWHGRTTGKVCREAG